MHLTEKIKMANLSITFHLPFSIDSNRTDVGQKWQMWLEEFEDELHLQIITDDNGEIICLKRYDGREIKQIVEYLPSTEQNRNDSYEEVKRKLNYHFIPKQNKQHVRYLFNYRI